MLVEFKSIALRNHHGVAFRLDIVGQLNIVDALPGCEKGSGKIQFRSEQIFIQLLISLTFGISGLFGRLYLFCGQFFTSLGYGFTLGYLLDILVRI